MNIRHIFLLAASALTLALVVAGPAAAKPGPLTTEQIVTQSSSSTPDLVERWLQLQPASAYYTPAALRADGLRMQAMARTYARLSATSAASSDTFDVSDALVGAAGGIGIAICAGGLVFAVLRSRRPQVAL
ncbi:MAG TPA: hypothetical protein VLB89_00105 [Gaiellaceae bacterium]|nr:hypothetical protein [Gaiellaceae bacterium]